MNYDICELFNFLKLIELTIQHFSFSVQNGNQMVQEGALTALASIADISQVLATFLFVSCIS